MYAIEKFCIFCGSKPNIKNKEHVIPKWLLEMTGDPNRKAFFGYNFVDDYKENPIRSFAFSAFTFPACEECNSEFSYLEQDAKAVIEAMLKDEPLSAFNFDTLLDWLDKVRVGLWLGYFYLDKNPVYIIPHLFIKSRLRIHDRFVFIYKHDYESPGINFIGTQSPSFQHNPTCFSLRINNYFLLNASHFGLCNRRLGFPYAKAVYLTDEEQILIDDNDFVQGLERKIRPIIKQHFMQGGTRLFQPIYKEAIRYLDVKNLHDNNYVKQNSMNWSEGIGDIFQEYSDGVYNYSKEKSANWIPDHVHHIKDISIILNRQVLDYQITSLKSISLDKMSKDRRNNMKKAINNSQKINDIFNKFTTAQIEKLFK